SVSGGLGPSGNTRRVLNCRRNSAGMALSAGAPVYLFVSQRIFYAVIYQEPVLRGPAECSGGIPWSHGRCQGSNRAVGKRRSYRRRRRQGGGGLGGEGPDPPRRGGGQGQGGFRRPDLIHACGKHGALHPQGQALGAL